MDALSATDSKPGSQFRDSQDADERPAPAHIKLGAKWVEVRRRRGSNESSLGDESEFETWPATPVESVAQNRWTYFHRSLSRSYSLGKG